MFEMVAWVKSLGGGVYSYIESRCLIVVKAFSRYSSTISFSNAYYFCTFSMTSSSIELKLSTLNFISEHDLNEAWVVSSTN